MTTKVYDVFGSGDRVVGALPPELEGKSPLEIVQFYQAKERQLIVQQAAGPQVPPPPPPPITSEQFAENPMAATQAMLNQQTVSREEFNRMTSAAQANMIATAKMVAREGKKYWGRLLNEMEGIARTSNPLDVVRPDWWETTYNYLVGANLSKLQAEDATAAAQASTNEGASGASTPPPAPRELAPVERELAFGFGLSEDNWRAGAVKLSDGRLPVTLDNRRTA